MFFKSNIKNLKRIQTSLNRDLEKGIVLDRNERVDYFDQKTFSKITKNISRYSLNTTPENSSLYKKIAKFHQVKTNNIYVAQGITECMSHIMFSMVKKNEEVILLDQTYPMYEVLCKLHNIKFRHWKFNKNLELDLKQLKNIISKKTKILFLVNPNLPIEYEFSEKYKKEILKICKKNNILLVYDEAYYHFGSKSEVQRVKKHKNLIVMRTFSKANLTELSLCLIRTLDAMGLPIKVQKNQKYYSTEHKKMHHLFTDINLTKNYYQFNDFYMVVRWRRL
mgnify:CR=1 FL=1